jgi:hypothetical protein
MQEAIGRLHMVEPEATITELMQRIAHFRQVDLELYAKALCLRRSAGRIERRLAKILVADVRFGSDSEVTAGPRHVRFPPGSGHLFVRR